MCCVHFPLHFNTRSACKRRLSQCISLPQSTYSLSEKVMCPLIKDPESILIARV